MHALKARAPHRELRLAHAARAARAAGRIVGRRAHAAGERRPHKRCTYKAGADHDHARPENWAATTTAGAEGHVSRSTSNGVAARSRAFAFDEAPGPGSTTTWPTHAAGTNSHHRRAASSRGTGQAHGLRAATHFRRGARFRGRRIESTASKLTFSALPRAAPVLRPRLLPVAADGRARPPWLIRLASGAFASPPLEPGALRRVGHLRGS